MRKLSILEGRVGELHKEKHEIAARLNEENRKIYHENTSLQIKINELSKVYEKSETARQSPTERVRDSVSIAESHTIVENEGLKGEIEQLETLITSEMEKNEKISSENQLLKEQIIELTTFA